MTYDTVLAMLTIRTDNLPDDFAQILVHERELVDRWMKEGLVERLYLRPTRNGAALLFKHNDEFTVRQLMTTLPLAPFATSIETMPLISTP